MTLRIETPKAWGRRGVVLCGKEGFGSYVVGDPCVVRDEESGLWRMFVFALPPGHGHAECSGDVADPAAWRLAGPLDFTNANALPEETAFKPFVVLDGDAPNRAARLGALYCLLLVADHRAKCVWRAWSASLKGPWTVEPGPLIGRGDAGDFDARHVDAVSAYAMQERGEIAYFYMGYPLVPQRHATSPYGSAQGAALESLASEIECGRAVVAARGAPASLPRDLQKLGPVLRPSEKQGHWASGWVGGLQLFRGRSHRWIALVNASPSPPRSDDESISREEPPPSLGGFAVSDDEQPFSGWRWCDEPIEAIADVPESARESGEQINFWRHYAVVLDDGRLGLFYNSGDYFDEKLFLKVSRR